MRDIPGIAVLMALAACRAYPAGEEARPGKISLDPEDVRDFPFGPGAAEPPWRDLVRHTFLSAPHAAIHPGPSPDGRWVAYATTEFGPRRQIALRAAIGASATQLTRYDTDSLFPRISPDGRRVAYASNREGNWDIFVARLDAPATALQVTFEPEDEIAPAWSPDGHHLAFSARAPGGLWRLVLVDVATRIKTFLGPGLYPDWSPDEKDPLICFQAQPRAPGGRATLWVVRPDGTHLREIVSDKAGGWSAVHPRFSPDGRWIAYATLRRSPEAMALGGPEDADDIWIVRPDGTLDTRLTDDFSAESWPAWGGDRVFFVSDRHGTRNLYSVQPKPLEDPSQ